MVKCRNRIIQQYSTSKIPSAFVHQPTIFHDPSRRRGSELKRLMMAPKSGGFNISATSLVDLQFNTGNSSALFQGQTCKSSMRWIIAAIAKNKWLYQFYKIKKNVGVLTYLGTLTSINSMKQIQQSSKIGYTPTVWSWKKNIRIICVHRPVLQVQSPQRQESSGSFSLVKCIDGMCFFCSKTLSSIKITIAHTHRYIYICIDKSYIYIYMYIDKYIDTHTEIDR